MTAVRDIEMIGAEGVELARYRISVGERVLSGWSRGRGVEVVDRPAMGRARGYVVDRGFRCPQQLRAFIGDYVAQAKRLDACPMGSEAIEAVVSNSETAAVEELLAKRGLQ
jgi:hypothetical protein